MGWETSAFKSLEKAGNPMGYELGEPFMVEYDKIDWNLVLRRYPGKKGRRMIPHLKAFVRHVRESKCYDVDYIPPAPFMSPFIPLNFFVDKKSYSSWFNGAAEFAVSKLNAVTPRRYTFKLAGVVKAVSDRSYSLLLLTLAVKLVGEDATLFFQATVDTDPDNRHQRADPKDYVLEELRLKPDSDSSSSEEDSAKDGEDDSPEASCTDSDDSVYG